MGKACDLGDSVTTITRVEETDLISTSLGNSEGNFVLIEFNYTFGGTKPAMVQEYRWKLEDGQGRTYNYAFNPTSNYEIAKNRMLLYEKINPSVQEKGAIVFKVAPDAKDFTLQIKDLIQPKTSKSADIPLSTG